jgi:hypothetical protein
VLTVGLVSFAMGAESGGQWGIIGAGTLMVCLPLMLAFILFQKQFLRASASPGSNKELFMLLAQISDTHFRSRGQKLYGFIDVNAANADVVSQLNALRSVRTRWW